MRRKTTDLRTWRKVHKGLTLRPMAIPKPKSTFAKFKVATATKKKSGGRPAKLWRYKRKGREYGSWRTTVDGKETDFETDNATEARSRWARAKAGDFSWQAQASKTTAGMFSGATTTAPPPQQSTQAPPPVSGFSAPPPQGEPRKDAPPTERVNAEYIPPPSGGMPWHEAARQASGAGQSQQQQAAPGSGMSADSLAKAMGFQTIEELYHFAGAGLAKAQLAAQAWVIRKRGVEAGKLTDANPMLNLLAWCHGVSLRQIVPNGGEVPLWVVTAGASVMCLMWQISTGEKIETDESQAPHERANEMRGDAST